MITAYNTEEKEVIGIFSTSAMAARYLLKEATNHKNCLIYNAAKRKGCLLKTVFNFRVAIRFSNEKQIEMMNGEEYLIINGYPEPHHTKMKGYDSTRNMLAKEGIKKGFKKKSSI